jgi:hypothetical protein
MFGRPESHAPGTKVYLCKCDDAQALSFRLFTQPPQSCYFQITSASPPPIPAKLSPSSGGMSDGNGVRKVHMPCLRPVSEIIQNVPFAVSWRFRTKRQRSSVSGAVDESRRRIRPRFRSPHLSFQSPHLHFSAGLIPIAAVNRLALHTTLPA